MPKFNMNWIYTIIIVMLALLFFTDGGGSAHVRIEADRFDAVLLAEQIDVVVEVGQQNDLSERIQRHFRVALQPVAGDFLFGFHRI